MQRNRVDAGKRIKLWSNRDNYVGEFGIEANKIMREEFERELVFDGEITVVQIPWHIFIHLSVLPLLRPSVHISVRPSIYPFVRSSIYPSVYLSVHLSIRPSVRLSICPSILPFVYLSVRRLSIRPSIYLSDRSSIRTSVYPFVYLSIHLPMLPSVY